MKKVIRKRNKLVQLAIKLKGEELKAVEYAIKLIDFMIDNNPITPAKQKDILIDTY